MSPEILRVMILVAVFVAVLLLVETSVSWLRTARGEGRLMNARLRLIARGMDRGEVLSKLRRELSGQSHLPGPLGSLHNRLEKTLAGAGMKVSAGTLLLYLVAATIVLFVLTCLAAIAAGVTINAGRLLLLAAFSVSTGFGLPMMVFSQLADRRRKRLQQQFPVALDVFVRGLRAGHPIAAALDLLTQEMQDPIGSEFGLAVDETTYGADLRDALQNMADRCGIDDMHMFVVSLSVQSETGGNLAEILENLSKVIRERASMMMKVRALSSEGRMTAIMLTALPVLAFTGLFLLNPRFYLDVADDPAFFVGFTGLLILYAIGFYTIRRMVDLKV